MPILGPKRLGYDAGIGCHSTQMKDFIHEFDGLTKPVCLIWGDQDFAAPPEVQAAYVETRKTLRPAWKCTSSPASSTAT